MRAVRTTVLVAAISLAAGCNEITAPLFRFGDGSLVLDVREQVRIPDLPADPASITGATLQGHNLRLSVEVQGCTGADHGFGLVAGQDFGDSLPLYTVFRLTHRAPSGATCTAVRTVQLTIDIRPIRPYVDGAGGPSALRFALVEPVERLASVPELLYTW